VTAILEPPVADIDAMDAETLALTRETYRALRSAAGWRYRRLWLRNHTAYLGVIFGFLFLVGNSSSAVADSGVLAMAGIALVVAYFLISRFKVGAYLKKWHAQEVEAKETYGRHSEILAHIRRRAALLRTT
jgi:hypothetical protein